MKKFVLFALMGLVMMGGFSSCKKDKQEKEFKEKIVGKWKAYSYKIEGDKYKKFNGDNTMLTATIASISDSYVKFINGY